MTKQITHELALKAIEAGVRKCRALQEPSTLAIVDAGGHLLAHLRVDNAAISTLKIAQCKAYTAVSLRAPTDQWMDLIQPGQPLFGLEHTSAGLPYVFFGGGLPVFDGAEIIGAVGVSGGPAERDIEIGKEMVAALQG